MARRPGWSCRPPRMDGIHRALSALIALRYGKKEEPPLQGREAREQAQRPLDIGDLANPRAKPRGRARKATPAGGTKAVALPVAKTPPKVDRSRTLVWSSAEHGDRRVKFRPEAVREDVGMELEESVEPRGASGSVGPREEERPGRRGPSLGTGPGRVNACRGGGKNTAACAAGARARATTIANTEPATRSSLLQWFQERVGVFPSPQSAVERVGSSGSSSSGITLSDLIASSGGAGTRAGTSCAAAREKAVSLRAASRPRGVPTLDELLQKARPTVPGGSLKRVPIARGVLDPGALRR